MGELVLDPAFRQSYGNLMRWFNLCLAQPEFAAVLGKVQLCSAAGAATKAPGKKEPAPKKEAAPKKEVAPKKEAATKKEAAPKKEASPKASPKKGPAAAAGSGASKAELEKKVLDKGTEIRELKDKLKSDGVTGKKLNNHEEIVRLVAELAALKTEMDAAPAALAGALDAADVRKMVLAKGEE